MRRLLLLLSLITVSSFAGTSRYVDAPELQAKDRAAINLNFQTIDSDLAKLQNKKRFLDITVTTITASQLNIGTQWNGNDSPLNIWRDGSYSRYGVQISHRNSGFSRVPIGIFQNFDALADSRGNALAFYGRDGSTDIQHGLICFSNVAATSVNAKYEMYLRSGSDSLPVITTVGNGNKGYSYTLFGPADAAYAASYPYGAYTPGSTIHVASDTGDVDSGIRIERKAATTGRYNLYVRSDGDFSIGEVDASTKRMVFKKTTGYLQVQGVYDQTTASAANIFVDSSGNIMRSTSALRYKKDITPLPLREAYKILDLQPMTYRSKNQKSTDEARYYGLIAEEVEKIDPRLVSHDKDGKPDGVEYERLAVGLISIIKDLKLRIEVLEKK